MSETEDRTGGPGLVITIYVIVVLLTASIGFIIGAIGPQGLDPELFGVVQLPPTPVGMAIYGGTTIGSLLGALLIGVIYVANRYDDAEPET
ncbi:cox cluster protein [Halobacteriales archaeon QH_7_66_36]|nr:MAG: cox cluster protein [Halobacteriales archaeon QH_7_66_36]